MKKLIEFAHLYSTLSHYLRLCSTFAHVCAMVLAVGASVCFFVGSSSGSTAGCSSSSAQQCKQQQARGQQCNTDSGTDISSCSHACAQRRVIVCVLVLKGQKGMNSARQNSIQLPLYERPCCSAKFHCTKLPSYQTSQNFQFVASVAAVCSLDAQQ
jgi:hypothetical protein